MSNGCSDARELRASRPFDHGISYAIRRVARSGR
jgi:hypothetical protein